MRCRMSENRLLDLTIIHARKKEDIYVDKIIDRLSKKKKN